MRQLREFAEQVKRMREAQKLFYEAKKDSPKKFDFLQASKKQERFIDEEIDRILNPDNYLF